MDLNTCVAFNHNILPLMKQQLTMNHHNFLNISHLCAELKRYFKVYLVVFTCISAAADVVNILWISNLLIIPSISCVLMIPAQIKRRSHYSLESLLTTRVLLFGAQHHTEG